MAFNRDLMSRAGGGPNAPGLFTYKTQDAITVVDAAGYFGGTTDGQSLALVQFLGFFDGFKDQHSFFGGPFVGL